MATSGTITYLTSDVNWRLRFKWSATTNTSTFKSTVNYSIQVYRSSSDTTTTNTSYYSGQVLILNANTGDEMVNHLFGPAGGIKVTVSANTWTTIGSDSFTVSHSKSTGAAPTMLLGGVFSNDFIDWSAPSDGFIRLNTISIAARISSAPNFTDEENPTITYYNTSGSRTTALQACISLDGSKDDITYRDIDMNGTSYTFELTDEERNILRNATLNGSTTRNVVFVVRSTVSGNTYYKSLTKTLTIVNCEPSVHSTYYDVNEATVALTQNSDIFIRGYSDIEFQVEATPKKGASITGYNTIFGSKSSELQKSTFYWADGDEITFTATDNRGITGSLTFPLEMIEYFPPTCAFEASNIALDEESGTSATAEVEVKGTFFNSTFGTDGVANELKIEILHTGLDDWFEIPDILWGDNVDGNNYTATFTVNGLDYSKKIDFQFRVSDKLTTTPIETDIKSLKLNPVFDWGEEDFNFNVPVNINGDLTVNGSITVKGTGGSGDYIIEQGTEAMGSNGTWYWTKWASGKAECYGTRNYGNMSISNSWGSGYYGPYFTQDLPDIFSEAPTIMDISVQGTESGYAWIARHGIPTAADSGEFTVVRFSSGSISQVYISFHAIGKWN